MERIYLDHNATTPLEPAVLEKMLPYLTAQCGNPSSTHRTGVQARYAVEKARRTVARLLGVRSPDEILFTSGGSESNNLAIRGTAFRARHEGKGTHLITAATEHKAVLDTCLDLRDRFGFELTILPVDEWGRVDAVSLADALRPDTVLVTIMAANNEAGTLNPLENLVETTARNSRALFHTDAVQIAGKLDFSPDSLRVDLASFSAHKFSGPKGLGALYVRDGTPIWSQVTGGGQEGGRRAGTENVAGIVGFAEALKLSLEAPQDSPDQLRQLREEIWQALQSQISGIRRNSHPDACLPNTLSVTVRGSNGQRLVAELSSLGYEVSTGSACTSTGEAASHVLLAMGLAEEEARGALRISLGKSNIGMDVAAFARAVAEGLRASSSVPDRRDSGP